MTVQIFLHDGSVITADIKDYNASVLTDKLNDQKLLVITVGDIIINKQVIKMIAPAQQ